MGAVIESNRSITADIPKTIGNKASNLVYNLPHCLPFLGCYPIQHPIDSRPHFDLCIADEKRNTTNYLSYNTSSCRWTQGCYYWLERAYCSLWLPKGVGGGLMWTSLGPYGRGKHIINNLVFCNWPGLATHRLRVNLVTVEEGAKIRSRGSNNDPRTVVLIRNRFGTRSGSFTSFMNWRCFLYWLEERFLWLQFIELYWVNICG